MTLPLPRTPPFKKTQVGVNKENGKEKEAGPDPALAQDKDSITSPDDDYYCDGGCNISTCIQNTCTQWTKHSYNTHTYTYITHTCTQCTIRKEKCAYLSICQYPREKNAKYIANMLNANVIFTLHRSSFTAD